MENTENRFSRTEALLGEQAMEKLKKARVAVFGIGGVGGHVVEALVRSGVGAVDIGQRQSLPEQSEQTDHRHREQHWKI